MSKKITKAVVGSMHVTAFDPPPIVTVFYDDGSKEELFSFFPDEIQFHSSEFIGLTRDEALRLKHSKDVSYLRS